MLAPGQAKKAPLCCESVLTGQKREVFASGIRNTIGFGWNPQTHETWGVDRGIDWLGDNEQGEEVNQLVQGARYGWPYTLGRARGIPFKPFLTGFLTQQGSGWRNSGRGVGVAIARDGSLRPGDDNNGAIYRIS